MAWPSLPSHPKWWLRSQASRHFSTRMASTPIQPPVLVSRSRHLHLLRRCFRCRKDRTHGQEHARHSSSPWRELGICYGEHKVVSLTRRSIVLSVPWYYINDHKDWPPQVPLLVRNPSQVSDQNVPIWCTDASTTRLGGFCSISEEYFSIPIPPNLQECHINVLELAAMRIGYDEFGSKFGLRQCLLDVTAKSRLNG